MDDEFQQTNKQTNLGMFQVILADNEVVGLPFIVDLWGNFPSHPSVGVHMVCCILHQSKEMAFRFLR